MVVQELVGVGPVDMPVVAVVVLHRMVLMDLLEDLQVATELL
jgi:hypothetical protein